MSRKSEKRNKIIMRVLAGVLVLGMTAIALIATLLGR